MTNHSNVQDFKSLIFKIGSEEYGVHINQVVSIERMQEIMPFPNRPPYVLGVATIRNIVTPIVDVRAALRDGSQQITDSTKIIIVRVKEKEIGLVVDNATDVLSIAPDTVQHPNLLDTEEVSYLKGISRMEQRLIFLLDIEKLLEDTTNLDELKKMINELELN